MIVLLHGGTQIADLADDDPAYIAYSFVDDPGVLQSLGSLEGVPGPVRILFKMRKTGQGICFLL